MNYFKEIFLFEVWNIYVVTILPGQPLSLTTYVQRPVYPSIADRSAIDCESAVCGETTTELWTYSSTLSSYLLLTIKKPYLCVHVYTNV